MKSVTKLKDDARKHEQKEEWDKAIQAYLQVLKTGEEGEGELDLPLYNRVGDLYLRLSKPHDAVRYYEQAADRYADAGLYNNAIALCNKALRYVPQQLDLLRKLGQFSASQGFLTDARRYFLEFAEKKFGAGLVDEALTALEEFADVSDDPSVREMLARQLHSHGRTAEAVDELKKAYAVRTRNGDQAEAEAVLAELEELAPGSRSALVAPPPPPSSPPIDARSSAPAQESQEYEFSIDAPDTAEPADLGLAGFESTHFDTNEPIDSGSFELQGFETTHAEPEVEDTGSFQLPDFESTAHEDANDLGLESTAFELPSEIEAEALPDLQFDETSFDGIEDQGGGLDLPLLDEHQEDGLSLDDAGESFELPSFEIESPDSDESSFELPTLDEPDEATEADAGGFELPTFDMDDSQGAATTDAGADPSDLDAGFELPTFGEEPADTGDSMFELPTLDAPEEQAEDAPEAELPEFVHDFGEPQAPITSQSQPIAEEPPAETSPELEDFDLPAAEEEADQAAEQAHDDFLDEIAAASSDADAAAPATDGGWDPSALGYDDAPAAPPPPPPKPPAKAKDGSDFVNLGDLLAEDDDDDAGTRFRVQEKAPTGDEDRDFAELLSQFKQKVSEHVSEEDSAAHYDLGLAFKEMGLVDEAISEFQIAMRAGDMRLRVYEELGQCFLMKDQYNIAEKVLKRALEMQHAEEIELIGVYYHLGRAYEGLGNRDAARDAYERVMGLDINFQDVAARLKQL